MGLSKSTIRQEIEQLASLRVRKGISLAAIEDQTKIRADYLRAIEEGQFEKLPDGIYRINYLTQYAGQIDQDIARQLNELLREWHAPGCLDEQGWSFKRPYWWANPYLSGLAMALTFASPISLMAQVQVAPTPTPSPCPADNRCDALVKFFKKYGSPLGKYAGDFLQAADKHNLDWRLLPSISMAESSGGKFYSHGNVFGWNSGRARFKSISSGIHYVAAQFGNNRLYAGKDTMGILRMYNPARAAYPMKVMRFIDQIPVEIAQIAK